MANMVGTVSPFDSQS